MQTKSPKLSVVMSVYNGVNYIQEALNSILAQTYAEFEFIIVDDGSTDGTSDILRACKDKRVRVLTQENQGLVASLNRGITAAHGVYIARQDADDRSEPDRFEKQMAYMVTHPSTILLGSSMSVMNEEGRIIHEHHVLLNDRELKQELLIRSPFAHGSVIFKKSAAKKAGFYSQEFWPAEDYHLWLGMSELGDFANLDECLYVYRENSAGISNRNQDLQTAAVKKVQALAWQDRSRLLKGRVTLKTYKKLNDGSVRVDRILQNTRTITSKTTPLQVTTRLRARKQIAANILPYRRAAGTIKRKLRGAK